MTWRNEKINNNTKNNTTTNSHQRSKDWYFAAAEHFLSKKTKKPPRNFLCHRRKVSSFWSSSFFVVLTSSQAFSFFFIRISYTISSFHSLAAGQSPKEFISLNSNIFILLGFLLSNRMETPRHQGRRRYWRWLLCWLQVDLAGCLSSLLPFLPPFSLVLHSQATWAYPLSSKPSINNSLQVSFNAASTWIHKGLAPLVPTASPIKFWHSSSPASPSWLIYECLSNSWVFDTL